MLTFQVVGCNITVVLELYFKTPLAEVSLNKKTGKNKNNKWNVAQSNRANVVFLLNR